MQELEHGPGKTPLALVAEGYIIYIYKKIYIYICIYLFFCDSRWFIETRRASMGLRVMGMEGISKRTRNAI